jgi:hypothetical protein
MYEFWFSHQLNADIDSFYLYVCMIVKRISPKNLMDLHILITPDMKTCLLVGWCCFSFPPPPPHLSVGINVHLVSI